MAFNVEKLDFLSNEDVIITGSFVDTTITKINVSGTEVTAVDGVFTFNLGKLAVGTYPIEVEEVDGATIGNISTITVEITAAGDESEPEPETEESEESEHEVSQEEIDRLNAKQSFIPDYVPSVTPTDTDNINADEMANSKSLYSPIETLEERFPHRGNLRDVHGELWGDSFHPDMIGKHEDHSEPTRGSHSSMITSGVTF